MVIRHELPEVRWPSAKEAAQALLFQPMRLGPLEIRRRSWVPAMVPWRATEEGFVTEANLDWYARFARGKPGVLVVEATGIRDIPSGPLLRIGHDRFIPGLKKLVERVQQESAGETRLLIQVLDFLRIRRRPKKEDFFARFLRLDADRVREIGAARAEFEALDEAGLRASLANLDDAELEQILSPREFESYARGYRETVNDLDLPGIAELPSTLPGLFADAAGRAKQAGFDGVELHYAHAYTMASFLSRLNRRDDGYGGSPEARVRLPLEVYSSVRDEVGDDYCVGCRILGDEVIPGGSRIEDACFYGSELAAAGMDYISISKGGKFEDAKQPKVGEAVYPYTGPSGLECMPTVRSDERGPFGRNVALATEIRSSIRARGLSTPVVTAGGIGSFELAESILQEGRADLVAAARQSLADPDWFLKAELGCGDQVRRCIYTNYCEGLDQKHKTVSCQLWDRDFDAPGEFLRSDDGKRRLTAPEWQNKAED
ncbi:MAG: oxidoreductase [Planctomycetota bacterium]|jgi:2,4-dienoyl-CoA reductase-like NADH-dependent reductase (Old Yellow Enzyme family)